MKVHCVIHSLIHFLKTMEGQEKTMEGFCRDSFWNQTLIWNTTHPQLTDCFQDTVMIGVPCVFLWIFTPFWLLNICTRRNSQYPSPNKKISTLILKFVCLVILEAAGIFKLIQRYKESFRLYPSDIVGPCLLLITYVLIAFLIVAERKVHIHTSPLQFYFWWVLTCLLYLIM